MAASDATMQTNLMLSVRPLALRLSPQAFNMSIAATAVAPEMGIGSRT